jgi:glutathione peroxidase
MKPTVMIVMAVLALALLIGGLWARKTFSAGVTTAETAGSASLYNLKTHSLAGEEVDLAEFQGKVALVVNTASKCGLTPQYEGLEKLYRDLADDGFVILGFPSNDFMGQEPGTPEEIAKFCSTNFDISFPLFEKSTVKGENKGPVYQLLTASLEEPTWNFTKYLVDKNGLVVARFGPRTKPDDAAMREVIDAELAR